MAKKEGFLSTLWKRAMLHGVQFADSHRRLDLLYKLSDPWGMETAREQYRFRETNAFLERHVGPIQKLLEIGCGEGHQTIHLQEIAHFVVGVDVSPTAIERARRRVPSAQFVAGDVVKEPNIVGSRPFDVVTGCEVLYYASDVSRYAAALEHLGRRVLVTYVDKHRDVLDPILSSKPDTVFGKIRFEDISWTIAMWRGAD